jgi:regulation of enolase protein 1 (concanavalin A-like superfamily)
MGKKRVIFDFWKVNFYRFLKSSIKNYSFFSQNDFLLEKWVFRFSLRRQKKLFSEGVENNYEKKMDFEN